MAAKLAVEHSLERGPRVRLIARVRQYHQGNRMKRDVQPWVREVGSEGEGGYRKVL